MPEGDEIPVSGIDKLAALIERLVESRVTPQSSNELSIASMSAIESRIQEFEYSPEDGSTFERWWNRHEDIFEIDLENMNEVKKIRLLIRHVSTSVERTFVESIAPTKWVDMSLMEVKEKMLTLFGDNTSIFDRRRTMLDLKMSKENIEDVRVLAARVNQTVENAQVREASIDEWKVLTFLHSLDLPRYSEVHLKMMQVAKQKGKACTLDDLISVFNDVAQLKKDSRSITESSREVFHVDRKSREHKRDDTEYSRDRSTNSSEGTTHEGRRQCYCCGSEEHLRFNCSFRSEKCNKCGRKGHFARMCKKTSRVDTVTVDSLSTVCYSIQVEIDGHVTSMLMDTGADITIINEETWKQLGMPDCKAADDNVICANGNDLRLRGKFCARMVYGGISATGDVYVTHSSRDILGSNFIKLLQLVKVRGEPEVNERLVKASAPEVKERVVKASAPAANGRVVKAGAPEANPNMLVKVRRRPAATKKGSVKAPAPEAHELNLVKVAAPEANETGSGSRHLTVIERDSNNVKRDFPEATNERLSNRKEMKAKSKPMSDSSPEGDNPFQKNRSSQIDVMMVVPSEYEREANDRKQSSVGSHEYRTPDASNRGHESSAVIIGKKGTVVYKIDENGKKQSARAIQSRKIEKDAHQTERSRSLPPDKSDRKRNDPVVDQRNEFREELYEDPKMELGEWDVQSDNPGNLTDISSPSASTSSTPLHLFGRLHSFQSTQQQEGHLPLEGKPHQKNPEGKPHKKNPEGKPRKKNHEGKPHKKTCSKEMKQ